MANVEWMEKIELQDNSYMKRKGLDRPFRAGDFVCVSDAHFLTAVRSDVNKPEPKDKSLRMVMLEYVNAEVSGPAYDLAHLQAWSKRDAATCTKCNGNKAMDCRECSGTGKVECECDCGECSHDIECDSCEGTKTVDCECLSPELPVTLFGKIVNIAILHKAIEHLSGSFQIGGEAGAEKPLILGGEDWRVTFATMINTVPKENYEPVPA